MYFVLDVGAIWPLPRFLKLSGKNLSSSFHVNDHLSSIPLSYPFVLFFLGGGGGKGGVFLDG
jgi:hypothetical protein